MLLIHIKPRTQTHTSLVQKSQVPNWYLNRCLFSNKLTHVSLLKLDYRTILKRSTAKMQVWSGPTSVTFLSARDISSAEGRTRI